MTEDKKPPTPPTPEHAKLAHRALAMRVAWVLALLAAGYGITKTAMNARENSRRETCGYHLKSSAIALSNYNDTYGSLPPAHLKNQDGESVLSWRVCTSDIVFYDIDYREEYDFSLPWNDPANNFLDAPRSGFQCPSRHVDGRTTTDYVAVTGPETMWPDEGKREWPDEDAHQPILIVEWPDSDIHWAEPRDVTIKEFLDWFQQPVKERKRTHPRSLLCIDTAMKIHELSLDSDPEEVRRMLTVQSENPETDDLEKRD